MFPYSGTYVAEFNVAVSFNMVYVDVSGLHKWLHWFLQRPHGLQQLPTQVPHHGMAQKTRPVFHGDFLLQVQHWQPQAWGRTPASARGLLEVRI